MTPLSGMPERMIAQGTYQCNSSCQPVRFESFVTTKWQKYRQSTKAQRSFQGWVRSTMAGTSSIEWTDATWHPVRGCTKVSLGCKNCDANGSRRDFAVYPMTLSSLGSTCGLSRPTSAHYCVEDAQTNRRYLHKRSISQAVSPRQPMFEHAGDPLTMRRARSHVKSAMRT
jgi:hypothetical protein